MAILRTLALPFIVVAGIIWMILAAIQIVALFPIILVLYLLWIFLVDPACRFLGLNTLIDDYEAIFVLVVEYQEFLIGRFGKTFS